MKVLIDNLNLNVVDSGSGNPALIFLHYWGGSARTWKSVTHVLESDFRCVALDQRGWGSSDAPAAEPRGRRLHADSHSGVEPVCSRGPLHGRQGSATVGVSAPRRP